MKNVMIATPSYDGKMSAQYTYSLFETDRLANKYGLNLYPSFVCYESIIQKVRNDLFATAYHNKVDGIFFIDADIGWNPQELIDLVYRDEDVVGGVVPSRVIGEESWNVYFDKLSQIQYSKDKELIKVEKIGTGFLRLTRKVIVDLWNNSEKYFDNNIEKANIFEVKIIDGGIESEDYTTCLKLTKLGYQSWGAYKINPSHVGTNIAYKSFIKFLQENNYKL